MNTSNEVPQFDRTLFGAGGVLEVEMNNHLSIVAEPMLLKKGGGTIEGAAIYHFFNRYYLEAPLLLYSLRVVFSCHACAYRHLLVVCK